MRPKVAMTQPSPRHRSGNPLAHLRSFLRRPLGRGLMIGLACALTAWFIAGSGPVRGLEDWMLDGCFARRGTRATSARVVLIGLDGASLEDLKKPAAFLSPELAEVVRYARQQGASAIGVDVFVPSAMSGLKEITSEGGLGEGRLMGQAVCEAGNVVLPEWRVDERWQRPLLQWQLKALNPELAEPTDLAFVNLTEDDDQFVRRQQLLTTDRRRASMHFALALHARNQGARVEWDDRGHPLVARFRIPLEPDGTLRINFVGPPGSFPVVSFGDVLADARAGRARANLAGAVVIIGLTDRGQQDYHATPYANHYTRLTSLPAPGLMAGSEIHAHVLATLQDRAFIRTPHWLAPLPLVLVFGPLLGYAFSRLNLRQGLLLAVGHHFAWKWLAVGAFAWFHWRLHVVAMLLLGALAYAATFALRWQTLRKMFGVVKSEAVALALESDPDRLDPGGEEREVTVLFADIRSFTTFSESHEPHEVVALLNAYFDAVAPAIEKAGGTIDKYMGDGIMALFGAPARSPDHALRATRAAVAMVRRVHELKERWLQLDIEKIWQDQGGMRIGVGVHTGKVVVGAIGSKCRVDYTAIGDTVNAAARIESENKPQGTEVLISEETRARLSLTEEDLRALGFGAEPRLVEVKGRKEKLRLYPVNVP
jgi:adenylate cyclase